MPNPYPPAAVAYFFGRERTVPHSPVGVPTPLHNVNAAGQFHRDVQSFMVPSLAHDTTCVIRCPIVRPTNLSLLVQLSPRRPTHTSLASDVGVALGRRRTTSAPSLGVTYK